MFFPRVANPTIVLAGKLFPDGRHNTCWQDPLVVPSKTSLKRRDTPQDVDTA